MPSPYILERIPMGLVQPFGCHHPRKRMIQYSLAPIYRCGGVYWMPAFERVKKLALRWACDSLRLEAR
jgi:hypothetical protein